MAKNVKGFIWLNGYATAKREENKVLSNQTISKLLNFKGVSASKGACHLQFFQPTIPQQRPNHADTTAITVSKVIPSLKKSPARTAGNKAFIVIAWILLALNVLAIVGLLDYEQQDNLGLKTLQITASLIFQLIMLAFGAFVLVFITVSCWKNKLGGTVSYYRHNPFL